MSAGFRTSISQKQYDLKASLKEAHVEYGVSPVSQLKDIYKLGRGATKITDREYYYFRLYDPALSEEKHRFVGDNFRAHMQRAALNSFWFAVGMDKLVLYGLCKAHGLPYPHIQALAHPSRTWPEAMAITNQQELEHFLAHKAAYPLFCKPVNSTSSIGAMSIDGYDAEQKAMLLPSGKSMGTTEMWQGIEQYLGSGYLFQNRLSLHEDIISRIGSVSSTLRIMVALGENNEARLVRCTWKVPAQGNYTDNFAREGNIIVEVDPHTGTTKQAVRSVNNRHVQVIAHPDTEQSLEGIVLPCWEQVVQLCQNAAQVYYGGKLQGWDIFISNEGPVIIELEPDGGGPTLSQVAQNKGLLDDDMKRHLHWAQKDWQRAQKGE